MNFVRALKACKDTSEMYQCPGSAFAEYGGNVGAHCSVVG
jgi:hypothetical protein